MAFYISLCIFLFTFMNTGVLLLLTNANLKSQGINLNGTYSDFNTNWYLIAGDVLTQTMVLNSFTPMIVVLINSLKFKILKTIDQF